MTSKKLKVENWPIDKLIPYARNPRKNDQAVEQVAAAIKEFGFRVPIVAKSDGLLVDGHLRLKAAQKLGLKEVPVVLADDLSDAQIKAFRISVNRMAELAEWDNELLALEFAELKDLGFDTSLTGFDEAMVSEIMPNKSEPLTDEDAVPEVDEQAPPKTKIGDVWILGNHKIMCGDSTDETMVAKLMNGVKADMVFTDPPYGMNLDTNFKEMDNYTRKHDKKTATGREKIERKKNNYDKVIGDDKPFDASFIIEMADEVFLFGADYYKDTIPQGGSWIVWDKKTTDGLQKMFGSDFELCWSKKQHERKIFRHTWAGCFGFDKKNDGKKRVHPTQKPVALVEMFLTEWGDNKILLCDLFLGSGSTLIACEKTGRKCYGMELSPQYISIIIQRWQEYTGKEAHLEETGETFNSIASR